LQLQHETNDLNKVCPVAKMTRTQKKKLKIESELDIQTQDEFLVPKTSLKTAKESMSEDQQSKSLNSPYINKMSLFQMVKVRN
jgi:hypothetical protein